MATDLRIHVEMSELTAAQIAARTRRIYDTVLEESPSLNAGNFTTIHPSDLARLFDLYDTGFFQAQLRATLGRTPVRFRLSRRMTRSAGQTARSLPTTRRGRQRYELSVSTTTCCTASRVMTTVRSRSRGSRATTVSKRSNASWNMN